MSAEILLMVKPFRKTQFYRSTAEHPATSKLLHEGCQEEVTIRTQAHSFFMCLLLDNSLDILVKAKPPHPLVLATEHQPNSIAAFYPS